MVCTLCRRFAHSILETAGELPALHPTGMTLRLELLSWWERISW
jgi:hypothetical protein